MSDPLAKTVAQDLFLQVAPLLSVSTDHWHECFQWVPTFESKDKKLIGSIPKLVISPESRTTTMVARGYSRTTFRMLVGIIIAAGQSLGGTSDDEIIDDGQLQVDSVIEATLGYRLGGDKNYLVSAVEQIDPMTQPQYWRDYNQFFSILRFTLEP